MDNLFTLFDPDEYYSREVEPLGEMATITTSDKPAMRIQINPERGRKGVPYFKVYNSPSYTKSTKVARLHFLDTGMEYHQDEFADWVPTNKEIKQIRGLLMERHSREKNYTNWQMTCWLWNMEYTFIMPDKIDEYMEGKFDDAFKDHPSYVPSTTPIPDTWEYNPPKGKNKRRNLNG